MQDFTVEPLPNVQQPEEFTVPPKPKPAWLLWLGRNLKWVVVALFVIVVAVVIWISRGGFSGSDIRFEINAPEQLTAGELIEYVVTYENTNTVGLSDVTIVFTYPQGSLAQLEDEIVTRHTETREIGTIAPGQKGSETFTAILIGDKGMVKTAQALMRYTPSNLRTEFEITQDLATTITSLAIPVTIVAPPSLVSGQEFEYIIDYRNDSNDEVTDLQIIVTYPEGFTVAQSRPRPDIDVTALRNDATWNIPRLRPGQGERITIEGTIEGRQREGKELLVELKRKTSLGNRDDYVTFQQSRATSVIASPPLFVTITNNGATDYVAQLGQSVPYTLVYRNDSNSTLRDVTIEAQLEGRMFDLATVNAQGFFDSRTQTIIWDSASDGRLANLAPNSSGTLTFTVGLQDDFVGTGLDTQDSLVKVTASIQTLDAPDEFGVPRLFADDSVITRIATIPSFTQKVFVADQQWGTRGPFPPRVNETTGITITWKLANEINPVAPATITAFVEPGVTWTGQVRVTDGQPAPVFNAQHNRITWTLPELPAGLGTQTPSYEAAFELAITPSINQIGDIVSLLRDIDFEAIDIFTGQEFTDDADNVTTDSVVDASNTRVQPALPSPTPSSQ